MRPIALPIFQGRLGQTAVFKKKRFFEFLKIKILHFKERTQFSKIKFFEKQRRRFHVQEWYNSD